ncbi:MAG: SAM-dependent methyltransferase [Mycobacteriales bacterium]
MTQPVPWRDAWQAALYGPVGFYRAGAGPTAHFRTSVHASPLFARALSRLASIAGLTTVVDVGAGGGELLRDLHALDPRLRLCGVDVAPRPPALPADVDWADIVPGLDGLLVANEWLDNVPCDIVEATAEGPRLVLVHPGTGTESLGEPVQPPETGWLERWWPLAEPGRRAEIGRSRDTAWADAVSRVSRGIAVAIDYAHDRADRPVHSTLTGFRGGREVMPIPDGTCDITAHVALDSCAAAGPTPALRLSQRAALHSLGITATLPGRDLARVDPAGYARALQAASDAAELTDPYGLGGFTWLVHAIGVPMPPQLIEAAG